MTLQDLREKMQEIANRAIDDSDDIEAHHILADTLLLKYINDEELTKIFHSFDKWYA